MKDIFKKPELKSMQGWVYEAQWAAREWRAQSWRSSELYDGGKAQWTQEDWDTAMDAGITPLTINRTFPTLNLILGYQILNQFDIIAKGRTQKDSDTAQYMTEGIQFVMDQYDGGFLVQQAFRDAVIPGIGCMGPCLNSDPRYEKLKVEQVDWKEVWWDPFGPVWWEPSKTRYMFKRRWMDVESLIRLFYDKRKEIEEQYESFTNGGSYGGDRFFSDFEDEATAVEEEIKSLSGGDWTDPNRRRVRPVEMWYTQPDRCLFALFPDGRYVELKDEMPIMEQYQVISAAKEVVSADVLKMRVRSFFGDIELQDLPSPYPHDEYPLIPFVGYVDRFGMPYGVPYQINGMQEEVNKRRSMAMALLKSRRVIMEQDAAPDKTDAGLQRIYEESNKLDGQIVLAAGGSGKFKIVENADLAPGQARLMASSENEINEIVGANIAAMGYESNEKSGVALDKKVQQSNVLTASVFENLRRSMKRLGNQVGANIQGFWTGEKVLRITDRMTGAEKFVELNKQIETETGQYEIKNNIAQGKYDYVVSDAPKTDVAKEKQIDLLTAWAQKSPPEAIPLLMTTAFELLDLPNKDILMMKIRPLLGQDPLEEDMTAEQMKQKVIQQLQTQQEETSKMKQFEEMGIQLDLQNKELENQKLQAEIQAIRDKVQVAIDKVKVDRAKVVTDMSRNVIDFQKKKQASEGAKA